MRKSIYGLSLSLNEVWPWCPDQGGDAPPDIRAQLGGLENLEKEAARWEWDLYYASPWPADNGLPSVRVYRAHEGHFRLVFSDSTEFILERACRQIYGRAPRSASLDETLLSLHGLVLGFALRLRGVTCLHASAVGLSGYAVAIVGVSGAGKSTTAAAFARSAFGVLTDDLLALKQHGKTFMVYPGIPRVHLWPDAAEVLLGNKEALPRIVPNSYKCYLDLTEPGYRFCSEPQPLGAVYVLGDRLAPGSRPAIEALAGTKALVHLVANTYANYLLDSRMRAQELEVLGRLVTNVPVRLVHAPDDRKAVPAVCDAILEDFQAIRTS